MENKKVIKSKYLPTRLPVASTLTFVIALDYWNAPQWGWGVMLTLLSIAWISIIYNKFTEEEIELIDTTHSSGQTIERKSKFMEKLENAMSKPKTQ